MKLLVFLTVALSIIYLPPLVGTVSISIFMRKKNNRKIECKFVLSIFYLLFFLNAFFWASLIQPQFGGIDLVNRLLSPILGPWSRFLKPNALTMKKCTQGFLWFSVVLSILMPVSITLTFWVKNKILGYLASFIGFCSVSVWVLYGFLRILMDIM